VKHWTYLTYRFMLDVAYIDTISTAVFGFFYVTILPYAFVVVDSRNCIKWKWNI